MEPGSVFIAMDGPPDSPDLRYWRGLQAGAWPALTLPRQPVQMRLVAWAIARRKFFNQKMEDMASDLGSSDPIRLTSAQVDSWARSEDDWPEALQPDQPLRMRREAAGEFDLASRLETIAQLLGKLSGESIAADEADIIGGLLRLGESLVASRLALAGAVEQNTRLDARLMELEGNFQKLRAEREQMAKELGGLRTDLAEERRRRVDLQATEDALRQEVQGLKRSGSDAQVLLSALEARATSLSEAIVARDRQLESERQARLRLEARVAAKTPSPEGGDRAHLGKVGSGGSSASAVELSTDVLHQIDDALRAAQHSAAMVRDRARGFEALLHGAANAVAAALPDAAAAALPGVALAPGGGFKAWITAADAANRDGQWGVAAARYAAILKTAPNHSAVWVQFGHMLKELGQATLAEAAYRRAISADSSDADARRHLGHLLVDQGRLAEGRSMLLTATHLDSTFAPPDLQGHDSDDEAIVVLAGLRKRLRSLRGGAFLKATPDTAPAPVNDFWPADTLRELVLETYGEAALARIWHLLSLMDRWQDNQSDFAASEDCRNLVARLQARALEKDESCSANPSASIVVPVYNNVLDTLLCLATVLELTDRRDFEIIVADDGSSDATGAIVPAIGGNVRYVRQPRNLGFLGNCNAAAAQARGRNLVFLNNDTLVLPGWLDALIDPIETLPAVGLVGSKLINWDGTLQEAGGIFWRDGSAWNFGRNQDVRAPEFNYLKDVDYCSGASIAVPAHIWREVGGFDPIYSPAYCEDSDLAFRLREAGYRTLYSPASEVVHHEGRSHGRDVTSGIKAYQVTNTAKFLDRWRDVLEREHLPNAHDVFRARDRSVSKTHVLVVDHYVPQWDKDAGSRTMFSFLEVLIEAGHAVSFWPDNLHYDLEYAPRLQAMGIEVIYGSRFQGGFERFLAERSDLYDLALLSRPHIAMSCIDAVRKKTSARVAYYGHDIHFRRMMAERQLAGLPADDEEVLATKTQEIQVCNLSDVVLYPSAEEASLMAEMTRPGVLVRAVPAYRYLPEDLDRARAEILKRPEARDELHLLFVGGFAHGPNVDAAAWFCDAVMPLLREASPVPVRLSIAGSNPPSEVLALRRKDIEVLGFVSDERLSELYAEADLAVAPLRFGAGVKGKVIEAMARGVPVVTTAFGAQGIDNAADLLFLGTAPEELAQQVILAATPSIARPRALAALDYVARHYSTETMRQVLELCLAREQDRR